MTTRVLLFLCSATLLLLLRIGSWIAARRGRPFLQSADSTLGWSARKLFLCSFLTLFAELAFIRWIAVEIRVFAYFKNLALLLCFVGFGLGCALVRSAPRWSTSVTALVGLVLVVRMPWLSAKVLEGISQGLGASGDLELWTTAGLLSWSGLIAVGALTAIFFLLLVWIFVPLGQVVAAHMDRAPRNLLGYSFNLAGNICGVAAFFALSRLMSQPWLWMTVVLVGFAFLQHGKRDRLALLALALPVTGLLLEAPGRDHLSMWTPYQQIEYGRLYARNGDFIEGGLQVNHTGYQAIVNLSKPFLERHPGLVKEEVEDNPYNVPFRFTKAAPQVLVIGAGTGNDVAASLRHGSRAVDAVEIDPGILSLGKREHPEHPYDSPLVSSYVTDARSFMKRTERRYDLILFALLDSHTEFSDYSNMRIDNFVYTMESLQEAREHLNPDGVLFLKFAVDRPWMGTRLSEMLRTTFGKEPLRFYAGSSYTPKAMCFAVSPSGRVESALAGDNELLGFVSRNKFTVDSAPVLVTTDDWPYLYQRDKSIPRTYLLLSVLVIAVCVGLFARVPHAHEQRPSLFYFSMGAGFMLLETQVISRLALFFGTTWQVNAIVISLLLATLLLANLVADRVAGVSSRWICFPLLIGLAVVGLVPFSRISGPAGLVGTALALLFMIPIFFAGLLFSFEFRQEKSPPSALTWNILGAVAGGLMENLSLRLGMNALVWVAAGLYLTATLTLFARSRASA